jgi:hypothetical protein
VVFAFTPNEVMRQLMQFAIELCGKGIGSHKRYRPPANNLTSAIIHTRPSVCNQIESMISHLLTWTKKEKIFSKK